jgi:hypothetical protein
MLLSRGAFVEGLTRGVMQRIAPGEELPTSHDDIDVGGVELEALCCTDQHPGAVRPPQRHLREANVLRPPKLEHPV